MDQQEINEQFKEAMLTLTGSPEWDMLLDELKKEIYQHQANLLDNAKNWDSVVFTKGWCSALAYIVTLRDRTKAMQEVDDANVQL